MKKLVALVLVAVAILAMAGIASAERGDIGGIGWASIRMGR
jgi:hypothetical protein